jgi:hypothetical protein
MAKYKIQVIALLLLNGKVAKSEELVEENQLSDSVEKLVEGGYITKPTAEEIKAWKKDNPELFQSETKSFLASTKEKSEAEAAETQAAAEDESTAKK